MKPIVIRPTVASAVVLGLVAGIAPTASGGGDSIGSSVYPAAACSSGGVDKSQCTQITTCDLFRGGCITYYICGDVSSPERPECSRDRGANEFPVPNAGPDLFAKVGVTVTLDGSRSTDPDDATLTYDWRLVSRPPDSRVEGAVALPGDPSKAQFRPDTFGAYVFELDVADSYSYSGNPDRVRLYVENDMASESFSGYMSIAAGIAISSIRLIDVDNDGDIDINAADCTTGSYKSWLNNGRGSFSAGTTFMGPRCAQSLVGNFNSDLYDDFIVRDVDTGQYVLMTGNGDGTFTLLTDLGDLTGAAGSIVTGDFNNDANLDIVTSTTVAANSNISVFYGNGAGSFNAAGAFVSPTSYARLLAGQFDGDGIMDFAYVSGPNTVTMVAGVSGGPLAVTGTIATDPIYKVSAGDINDDGIDDLVIMPVFDTVEKKVKVYNSIFRTFVTHTARDEYVNTLAIVLSGSTAGSFSETARVGLPYVADHALTGYYNADTFGDLTIVHHKPKAYPDRYSEVIDLVTHTVAPEIYMSTLTGDSSEIFTELNLTKLYSGAGSVEQVVRGDLNGDGKDDLVFYTTDDRFNVKVSFAESSATVIMPSHDIVVDFGVDGLWARMNDASWLKLNNNSPDQVATADMDGNGEDDVIAVFGTGIFVKRNLGGWAQLHNFMPDAMAVGDLDGNGKDDLVIDFGNIGLWARLNDASWLKLNNSSPDRFTVGDIGGNGQDEVIAVFGSGIFVKRNLGGWTQLHNFMPDAMAVGDLDSNGKDDLVIDFGNIGLWARMNDSAWLKLHNSSPELIAAGDLDGNGAEDVLATFAGLGLWQKLNLGGWSVLSANGPEDLVTGDITGSGKDDIIGNFGSTLGGVFVKRDQGAWTKLHNSNSDSFAAGNLDSN